jgi:small-conductance mechanosensitive channel
MWSKKIVPEHWVILFMLIPFFTYAQTDTLFLGSAVPPVEDSLTRIRLHNDSLNIATLNIYRDKLLEIENMRINDSMAEIELENQIKSLKTTDKIKKDELQKKIEDIQAKEKNRIEQKKAQINILKENARGYPVLGPLHDTLFIIYNRIGSYTAYERAERISKKISLLYEDDFLAVDSINIQPSDEYTDIFYKDIIIMSVSESDALWDGETDTSYDLAGKNTAIIRNSIAKAKAETSLSKTFIRIGLVILIIAGSCLIIRLINKLYVRISFFIRRKKNKSLKNLSYKGYTFLSVEQELKVILFVLAVFKWVSVILAVYFILPLAFSIFPFTRSWSDYLFGLIWSPFRKIVIAIWTYLPNLFTVLVIFLVFRYLIRLIKYIFSEIAAERLKLSGFYADWAMPTFNVLRFLLYAFAFIMIFPYLPGSSSPIFTGVSMFLGLLVSLGSSSAISNIIAGLVITYMRPFKIGDRIKLGDTVGDVVEKTILVTRLRTVKNEEITIPNSAILTGNTTNYSSFTKTEGLIIHTNITMGYEYEWQDMHRALIEAAGRTDGVQKDPKPFVLQVSLDDFYVTYQLNAYIQEANKQSKIYSELHQNIQNVFNEKGFELLSPHYRAERDGNAATFPKKYMPEDPDFNINKQHPENN